MRHYLAADLPRRPAPESDMWPPRPVPAIIAAALAIALATPALGAEPPAKPPEPTAKPSKAASPKEKLICTTDEVAGSLIPKRVCRTQKQIDAQLQATEDL